MLRRIFALKSINTMVKFSELYKHDLGISF